MTFWKFFTTRYTDHLEQENADLKRQLADERAEVKRLTEAAIPGLRKAAAIPSKWSGYSASDATLSATKHHIAKATDNKSASCACGWKAESEDPIELQEAISEHYCASFPPAKIKAVTLSDIRRRREAESLQDSPTSNQEKLQ
jgi:hypothetical protein